MMATGYVHPVADGEITDLRTFALRCSRAMMPLITMRDDNMNVLPPAELPLDLTHYEERLAEAEACLDSLAMMTDAERQAAVDAEYERDFRQAEEYDAKENIERDRVKAMRAKVEAWQGGPEGLKKFMIEQIDRSLGGNMEGYSATQYVRRRGPDDAWRKAVEEVGRVYADIAREKALHKARNAWLAQLWASLPAED